MLSSGLRIPLLSLLLLLLLEAMELSWSFTDEEKKQIVDQHNLYRSMVSPSAADMRKMRWDKDLEAFAKNYSTKCTWEHNKERGFRGENLFAMTGNLDLETAMDDWYTEYQYYNYSTLACQEGEMCGHYTQVVWATSERVGCGTTFCETLELINDTDMHLLVCNYQPPGNIRGHKPYIEGASCSMCPDGYFCINNLCDPTAEETTEAPTVPELETTTILTASPGLQSTITVSPAHTPETPQIGTEPGSELPAIDDQDTTPGSETGTEAQPIGTEGLDVDLTVPDLKTGTDGIDESLMTTTSTTSFVHLIPSFISPETETEKTTGTERPSSADVLITTQASLIETERPVTTLTTTKTPSTPTLPSVPKSPSVPKTPSVPKPPSAPKTPSVPKPPSVTKAPSVPKPPSVTKPPSVNKPPSVTKPPSVYKPPSVHKPPSSPKPHFFPKPPPIPIKRPISKKPARHRLLAYSKAIQRSSNYFQSSVDKAASMSVCLPCLGCKQISQPEDIKSALEELTFRYPYAPCFGSLPRWQRHSKCSWCGHTQNNALRNTKPYWLHSL